MSASPLGFHTPMCGDVIFQLLQVALRMLGSYHGHAAGDAQFPRLVTLVKQWASKECGEESILCWNNSFLGNYNQSHLDFSVVSSIFAHQPNITLTVKDVGRCQFWIHWCSSEDLCRICFGEDVLILGSRASFLMEYYLSVRWLWGFGLIVQLCNAEGWRSVHPLQLTIKESGKLISVMLMMGT